MSERLGYTVFIALGVYALFFDGLRTVSAVAIQILGG
jgi:hypothetical protein